MTASIQGRSPVAWRFSIFHITFRRALLDTGWARNRKPRLRAGHVPAHGDIRHRPAGLLHPVTIGDAFVVDGALEITHAGWVEGLLVDAAVRFLRELIQQVAQSDAEEEPGEAISEVILDASAHAGDRRVHRRRDDRSDLQLDLHTGRDE